MFHRARGVALVVAAVAALQGVASAQDRIDLTGAWTAPTKAAYRAPPSVVFGARTQGAKWDQYSQVRVIARYKDEVRAIDLRAIFNGKKLAVTLQPSGSSQAGDTDGLSALGSSTPNGALANGANGETPAYVLYDLEKQGTFERFVYVQGKLPNLSLPEELRRPKEPDARAPAEWEPSEEILWGYQDAFRVSRIYIAAIKGTHKNGEKAIHRIFVSKTADLQHLEYEFGEAEVPLDYVQFSAYKFQTVWMRDYGPIMLEAAGKRIVGDMGYFPDRPLDNSLPAHYAQLRGFERRNVEDLYLEGGNYISDGKGRVMVTNRALQANKSQEHVESRLRKLGAREVLFFERMPEPEGTGHIDMFMKQMDDSTMLVGKCVDDAKFAAVLERNAQKCDQLGYKVVRITMADGKKLMTYTNSLFVGSTVLVPIYKHPTLDKEALDIYRNLGWKPIGIDARVVIQANGAIHCISMQVPR